MLTRVHLVQVENIYMDLNVIQNVHKGHTKETENVNNVLMDAQRAQMVSNVMHANPDTSLIIVESNVYQNALMDNSNQEENAKCVPRHAQLVLEMLTLALHAQLIQFY